MPEEKQTQEQIIEETTETQTPIEEETQEEIIARLTEEIKEEANQRYLRIAADFDNFRKRTAQEKEELAKYSIGKFVTELLPVLDNFERALTTAADTPEVQNFLKGMEMIYSQLTGVLAQEGVVRIEAAGKAFDPNLHEAIMQVPDDTVEDNTVLEELRAGYMLKEKVLRPTMCKVSSK